MIKNAISSVVFEFNSLIGRKLFSKRPIKTEYPLANIGSSSNYFEGWVNADFFPNYLKIKRWKKEPKVQLEWMLDLRFPLNCSNECFEGIYCSHTIEHLSFDEAQRLFHEFFRVMKKGAIVRIIVPSLPKYISYYLGKNVSDEFNKFNNPCFAIHSLTQNYGHRSCWDLNQFILFLSNAGFVDVREEAFNEGSDARLLKDAESRKWESLYIEARKP